MATEIEQQLLAVVLKCEALLSAQKWLPEGDAPESVLLREARAAIADAGYAPR